MALAILSTCLHFLLPLRAILHPTCSPSPLYYAVWSSQCYFCRQWCLLCFLLVLFWGYLLYSLPFRMRWEIPEQLTTSFWGHCFCACFCCLCFALWWSTVVIQSTLIIYVIYAVQSTSGCGNWSSIHPACALSSREWIAWGTFLMSGINACKRERCSGLHVSVQAAPFIGMVEIPESWVSHTCSSCADISW